MIKRIKYLACFLVGLLLIGCGAENANTFASLGTAQFTPDAWKNANQEARATLLHSFVGQYDVRGMKPEKLKELLGESTGYYDYDKLPAYLVGSKDIHSEYGNGYLLAFPVDHSTGLIKSYVVIPPIKE